MEAGFKDDEQPYIFLFASKQNSISKRFDNEICILKDQELY